MAEAIFRFPKEFLWGTATAAHQVEGCNNNSWSHWENIGNGRFYPLQKHGLACDWWGGRWQEDFDRMRYLGNNTHRLSIEWSRIQPTADTLDEKAIVQYQAMLKGLRERNIRPMVTLHHFTNPMWLENEGGWLAASTVDRFVRWAEIAAEAFGDCVDLWCTINEPMVYALQAYLVAMFYPGRRNPWKMFRAAELLLRAHAGAYAAIKSRYPAAEVGLAKHLLIFEPLPPRFLNRFPINAIKRLFNLAFLEAMATGELRFPLRRRVVIPELAGKYDYIGINYYQRYRAGISPLSPHQLFLKQVPHADAPPSPPLWGEIHPQGLFPIIKTVWNLMRKPVYITETGTPDRGDDIRRWYIAQAVRSVWKAVNFNIPVKGIYYWTLMDNFEWTAGYNPDFRFGLYEVNFETQERTPRPSAEFYRAITLANGLSSDMVRDYVPYLLDELFPGRPGFAEVTLPTDR
jgi:beta-glucosidase